MLCFENNTVTLYFLAQRGHINIYVYIYQKYVCINLPAFDCSKTHFPLVHMYFVLCLFLTLESSWMLNY